jgi:hypothetical protein
LESHDEGVDVHVEAVNERNWMEHGALNARLVWDERAMPWGLYAGADRRDLVVPLVPLPAFEVTIENHTAETVSFAGSSIALTDDGGRSYPVFADPSGYMQRVVDRLGSTVPEMLPVAISFNSMLPVWNWDPVKAPTAALVDEAAQVPLLNDQVEIAPGGTWRGALVADIGAQSPEALGRMMKGRLSVTMTGAHAGQRELLPWSFAFVAFEPDESVVCSDGTRAKSPAGCARADGYATWTPGGPCLQAGDAHDLFHSSNVHPVQYLDGRRVANSDMYSAILSVTPSRKLAERARALRIAGYTLLGVGVVGAATTAGALGATHHSDVAPAGLGLLGVSAVGAVLLGVGHHQELEAVRAFNQYAFATGACVNPL